MHDRIVSLAGATRVVASGLCRALVLALVPTSALLAQQSVSVDLGSARVRYADTLSTTALTISSMLQVSSPRAFLQASGTLSQLGSDGWTTQGALLGTLYTAKAGPFLGELTTSMGASAHRDGTRTGQLLGLARAHLVRTRSGVWLGAGAGGTWDGQVWRGVRQAEFGAWTRPRTTSTLLTLTPTMVDDTIKYLDSALALGWHSRPIELSGSAGYRFGDRLPALGGTDRAWGSISLIAWVKPWAGLVAAVGSYPVDLTQGFPGGRYVTLGVRFSPRRQSPRVAAALTENAIATTNGTASTVAIAEFQVMPDSDSYYLLRLRAPYAGRVDVMADFTDWQPLPLTAAGGGWWTTRVRLARGTHQLNARTNGGPWLVPPGLTAVTDEFGGRVGILVVSR